MTENELLARTKQFALRVMKLVDALPEQRSSRVVGDQLLRSGTSVGANYRAACRGRSMAEFVAKLGTVEEEADESMFWMELIMEYGLMARSRVMPLHHEANELVAIMAASKKSARRNGQQSQIANRKSQIP